MKTIYSKMIVTGFLSSKRKTLIQLAFLLLPIQVLAAEGSAVKLEFGGTSMTVELSQQPVIVTEDGCMVLKTSTMSVTLSLPCTATFVGASHTAIDKVVMRNNDEEKTLSVFTLDGRKVATLKGKNELITLKRGIYIINGKKMMIKPKSVVRLNFSHF